MSSVCWVSLVCLLSMIAVTRYLLTDLLYSTVPRLYINGAEYVNTPTLIPYNVYTHMHQTCDYKLIFSLYDTFKRIFLNCTTMYAFIYNQHLFSINIYIFLIFLKFYNIYIYIYLLHFCYIN